MTTSTFDYKKRSFIDDILYVCVCVSDSHHRSDSTSPQSRQQHLVDAMTDIESRLDSMFDRMNGRLLVFVPVMNIDVSCVSSPPPSITTFVIFNHRLPDVVRISVYWQSFSVRNHYYFSLIDRLHERHDRIERGQTIQYVDN